MANNLFKIRVVMVLAAGGILLSGCETTGLGRGLGREKASGSSEVPAEGLLSAKLAALKHAMDELPAEDRRYLTDDYAAYGLLDTDPTHQKLLVKLLEGRQPPVVPAEALYSRSSGAQWFNGEPALKWTASAGKDASHSNRAEVVVGWMHSQVINRFTTYVLEYDGDSWAVVEVKLLEEAERALRGAAGIESAEIVPLTR